jgi:alcohol dehydrogenase
MQALVYHGPGDKQWESKAVPNIEDPNDAIVKIDTTTICGTDLQSLRATSPR